MSYAQTFVGSVLCVVNPFEDLSIYGQGFITQYDSNGHTEKRSLPPHIFGTAHRAYQSMVRYQQNQSIIVSGESGAGKTESTKHILKYLTAVSGHTNGDLVARQVQTMKSKTWCGLSALGL